MGELLVRIPQNPLHSFFSNVEEGHKLGVRHVGGFVHVAPMYVVGIFVKTIYSCAGCLETPSAFLEAVLSAWTDGNSVACNSGLPLSCWYLFENDANRRKRRFASFWVGEGPCHAT